MKVTATRQYVCARCAAANGSTQQIRVAGPVGGGMRETENTMTRGNA